MKNYLVLIALFLSGILSAQTNAYLKKGELQIGEQTELVYEFMFDKKEKQPSFQAFSKIIPCNKRLGNSFINTGDPIELEIIGAFKDTIIEKKGFNLWRGTYQITVWDSGQVVIPECRIVFKDSTYNFYPLLLNVSMPKTENGKDIYDIKESFVEIETDYFSWITDFWWIWTALILLGIIFYILRKRSKKPVKEIIKELSLKDKTLLALDGLEKAKMWEKEQIKEHYIELSFIFRSYLASRYELNLLEKTSYETALLLAQKNIATDTIETIKSILDYADMVKFAKSKPNEFDVLRNLAQVRQIVAETSPLEINHV
ncbi:MAG: hypothetical protein ACK5B9_12665 [Flavobacteriia bacterium]|jgi:cbb3-type cytochrome oxidase subunit 3